MFLFVIIAEMKKRIVTSFQDTVMFIYVFVKIVSTKY